MMMRQEPAKNWGQPTLSQGALFAAWTERTVPNFSPCPQTCATFADACVGQRHALPQSGAGSRPALRQFAQDLA